MKLLQINRIEMVRDDYEQDDDILVADSFDELPYTKHKDGAYRLRRYSVIELRTTFWNAKEEAVIERLEHRSFHQNEDLNKHQGGMTRSFEEIEEDVLQSRPMKEMCLAFKDGFDLVNGQEIEIHQMRVATLEDGTAPPAPEGVHQDGFDYIAIIGIGRHNIDGGAILVYTDCDAEPHLKKQLCSGEIIMLDDTRLWHNATPIRAIEKEEQGYADWFILCANKGQ